MHPTFLVNLRDVGAAHPSLAKGMLLRSDAPLPGDVHSGYDVAWPPRTVIDLRDPAERDAEHPLVDVAEIAELPVMGGKAYDPAAHSASFDLTSIYTSMLSPPAARLLAQAVDTIARSSEPVLVHCAAGKDRTGAVVALTLRLLGIDRSEIVADYLLTNGALDGIFARCMPRIQHLLPAMDPSALERESADAPDVAINALLDELDAHEGGAEGWYLAAGGTPETLTLLRMRLLVKKAADPG